MNETDQLNWQRDNFENIETAWEGDLWERRRLGEQLTNYVDRLQCGAVLALDARWGEGKTWFVRHWKRHLETTQPHKHGVIYLDAFANDYLQDPFLVIASEIAAKLNKTADKSLVHKFKKAAAVMQQGLLTLAPTLIASIISCAVTGGIIPFIKIDSENIKGKIDDAIDSVAENIGEKITEAIQNKIDSYEEEKQSLLAFKSTLSELAASLDKPLVFIIDELDRCRPDFAIRLIERIKHFFDIPKIVFILVMNKKQFVMGVKKIYGYDDDSSKLYLDKFIDFEVPLRNEVSVLAKTKENLLLIKTLLDIVGENSVDIALVFLFSLEGDIPIRELKRKINLYALLRKEELQKNIFIASGINKKRIDMLRDMEGIAVKIQKMQSGSENLAGINMAHFNIDEFIEIIEQKLNVKPLLINDYFKELSRIEQLRVKYNNERYMLEFNEFLNKYALQPKIDMEYQIFVMQYQNYLKDNVWLDSDN
ncbi:KAP family P-loop NTPase fold protein [Acinetobacter kookii]|uniref:KAP family P-loop NTPase fold protein n=1 Tax=unclassified Acinetobacter TaxID=196816 RepID=UPI0021B81EE4|nr:MULTISPECIES: KAP family NTPase [unclassified Acinetobacter]MCT8090449.1 P-loop ATPase [Acinetobacter sp. F_3_1]MCT8098854.1 P-loop ATPase [Acinetobacter sp. C_3_1]MCT8102078.1 P-loop ATPase [Acinetobacter sp. C_4_1]MCT8135822.1 P-loop ATPase [Acinetobacter sp. T_3_1]